MANSTPQYPDPQAFETAWAQLVSGAWQNPQLKSQLQSDPAAALASKGVKFPSDVRLQVHDGASGITVVLPLPSAPPQAAAGRLAADDDGVTVSSSCCCSC
ncbi:MAG TPA: hypothetical protein VEX86_13890 [Longimicrobium sp.]|nr:hypothetical protein [Longimicrobium sp.]